MSETLSQTQRKYSQIHKEAFAVIFALTKFHHFLYGRKFIVITDHKPLISLSSQSKATRALAANHFARWARTLSQYDYLIEYRQSTKHGNADGLNRLPSGPDPAFDKKEGAEDMDSIFTIKTTSRQIRPTDARVVSKESSKDPVVSAVMRYCKEGWPNNKNQRNSKGSSMSSFKHFKDLLSCESGYLFVSSRSHWNAEDEAAIPHGSVLAWTRRPNHGHVPFVSRVHGTSEQSSASSHPSVDDARKVFESSTH